MRAMTHGLRLIAVLLLLAPLRGIAQDADSSYVWRSADGQFAALTVAGSSAGPQKRVVPLQGGTLLRVEGVGAVPAFDVQLRPPADVAPEIARSRKSAPIFVVADTHGEYEILAGMLQAHRVIDARLRWSFKDGHLVVLGDVFDRGAHQVEILWLLYELEAQARRAGGALHFVLGNHELMVLGGDLRYLHPKYLDTTRALGAQSYSQLFGPDSVLGQWLRSRPAVLKLDDTLYLHGGLSPGLVDRQLTQAQINAAIREVAAGAPITGEAQRERAQYLMGQDGPLWYRGYFADAGGGAADADISRLLTHFGARRIVVGHTRVPTIQALYDGRVLAVQVYPRRTAAGVEFETLMIRDRELLRCRPDGTREPLGR
jgi:hypothetical protein